MIETASKEEYRFSQANSPVNNSNMIIQPGSSKSNSNVRK
jgi:hypothetical protein